MTALEKLNYLLPEEERCHYDDQLKLVQLSSAKTKILLKRYGSVERIPNNTAFFDNSDIWTDIQARLALILINRIGMEGETYHYEEMQRIMSSEAEILDEITPLGFVSRNNNTSRRNACRVRR